MPINQQEVRQLSHLELIAKQVVEGFITGLHKSPFHGFSVEFAEHRLYNSGESTRHIDWKLFGRTDKLFVKKYEEETNLRCQIIIDNSSSMHFPGKDLLHKDIMNKITFSSYCAAAMMNLLKMQRDAVGLSIFSDKLEVNTPARSSTLHQKLLFLKLEEALDSGGTDVKRQTAAAEALHQIAETIHKRSLVIIFSDMMDNSQNESNDLFNALQHLKYNKHEVILFHVTDKKLELDFKFENRPYQFIDVETGETVKVHSNQVREIYLEKMNKFHHELKLRCAQYKIDFIEADINEGYKQVLLPYIIKRQKMN
ncbi:MAG: DUF58 domain-containing protein [Bacteroidetes bacterium]|nr:DUF58 domain-containing protein [Bacteroidota bacterium]